MKKLQLNQMENLEGGWDHACAFALGFGVVTAVASGGWSLVAASMFCSANAY